MSSPIQTLKTELSRANRLLEYYRQFAPESPGISVPPPGYFVHATSDGWVAGRLIDGHLHPLPGHFDQEEEAVALCNQDHQETLS